MFIGIIYALIAGLMWGLVFVSPLLLPEYPPALQSVGRYLAFGLIALPLAWLDRRRLSQMSRADWKEALKLAAVGNLLYYLCLASAIQRAGGPLPTMIKARCRSSSRSPPTAATSFATASCRGESSRRRWR